MTAITKSADWKPFKKDESYSSDDLIDAYLKGHKDGLSKQQQAIFKLLDNNIKKSIDVTEKVLSELKNKHFTPKIAYLKINSWNNLTILILIPKEQFLEDSFLQFYTLTGQLEKEVRADTNVSFSFSSVAEGFEEDIVYSEGFVFRHEIAA